MSSSRLGATACCMLLSLICVSGIASPKNCCGEDSGPNRGKEKKATKKVPHFKNELAAAYHMAGLWVMSPEKTTKANAGDTMAKAIAQEAIKSKLEIARDIPGDGFYYNRVTQNGQMLQNDPVKLVINRVRGNRVEISSGESLEFTYDDELVWHKEDDVMVFLRKKPETGRGDKAKSKQK